MNLSRLLTTTALTGMALSMASVAQAQTQPSDQERTVPDVPTVDECQETPNLAGCDLFPRTASEAATTGPAIVVTGSRIARPNDQSASPITSIDITETIGGNVNLGDALNELPSLGSTFSQANSTRFIGTAGLNLLDLRRLGTNRTLVLVNGRRHITSQPGVPTSVDVNSIPAELVERIDILTGGNSALYGADAVAGVVNFILKRDFDGIEGRAQGGVSDRGDRNSYFAALTAGKNFADGRGNFALSGEYSFANDLYAPSRDDQIGAFSGRRQFNATENTLNEPAGGNGVPDTTFLIGVRNNNISEGGLFTSACPVIPAGATGAALAALQARRAINCTGRFGVTGNPATGAGELGNTFVFNQDGRLVRNNITADFRPFGSSNSIGGQGSTLNLTTQLQPQLERKSIQGFGHFEISPAFVPFIEAKYVRIDAIQAGQPTFFNNTFSLNNPFLNPADRALLVQSLPAGATSFNAFRFNVDFGARGEDHLREIYRAVAGVGGTFNDDWNYEVAFNYGRLETFYETRGNVIRALYANSINAVRNASGQIVCGINADSNPGNDDPACVPVNLFGFGAPQQAALDYFGFTSSREEKAQQYQATAYVSGDLYQLFELPGGPIRFSVGGEYRRETAFSKFDDVTQSGATFLNAIPTFDPPALKVYEGYGELLIPLLANTRFAEELSIEAAGRVSDYNIGDIGTVYTYNVGGIYSPVRGFRARGSYARSVRAPTQDDLFSSPSQTFLNGFADPCSQNNIRNNPNRVANCAAAGVPTTLTTPDGRTIPFVNATSSGLRGLSGSNPNLQEEKSTSFTAGAVFQPPQLPGLTLSVDYYNIKIENVIFSLAAQTIINQCFDSPSGVNNQFCGAINRRPDGTFQGQADLVVDGVTVRRFDLTPDEAGFLQGPFNFARQETSGIDADLRYAFNFGNGIKANIHGIVAYVIKRDNFTDIDDPSFINQQLLELGDPQWNGSLSANLDFGDITFNYNFRYIGKQTIGNFETQNSLQGRPAENPDAFPRVFYPDITYSDVRIGFDVNDQFNFYTGVDNVFDRLPPFGLTGTGGGSGIYDNVGRYLYAGARVKF